MLVKRDIEGSCSLTVSEFSMVSEIGVAGCLEGVRLAGCCVIMLSISWEGLTVD